MWTAISDHFNIPLFFMKGFPGADAAILWLSVPISLLFLLSILGNSVILIIIKLDNSLREPMFFLLSMLAVTNLGVTFCTMPTVLAVFWFDFRSIHLYPCLLQLYLMHLLGVIESAILAAMAFDRYVAKCNPLRYIAILHPIMTKIGLVALIRGLAIPFPLPFLLKRLPFCNNTALSHAFCYHSDMMKLACADTTINDTYGLVRTLTTFPLDLVFILFSYVMILAIVLSNAKKAQGAKAFYTCISHLCVIILFYVSLCGLSLVHRYGRDGSPMLLVLTGWSCLIIPPALNPIVYSIKNKQIQIAIQKHFCGEKKNDSEGEICQEVQ